MKYYKVTAHNNNYIYRNNPDLHFVELMYWSVYVRHYGVWVDSSNPKIFSKEIEEITEQEAFIELL